MFFYFFIRARNVHVRVPGGPALAAQHTNEVVFFPKINRNINVFRMSPYVSGRARLT